MPNLLVSKWLWSAVLCLLVFATCRDRYLEHTWSCEQLNVKQAEAFLRGELNIDVADMDTAIFNQKFYVPYPPTPALLFVPLVALFGPQPFIPYFLGFLTFGLIFLVAHKICLRCGATRELSYWLCLGFGLGTGLWLSLQYSYSATYNSHLLAVLFCLAGIYEAMSKGRGWLVGLFLSAAITTRPFTAASGLLMAGLLWQNHLALPVSKRVLALAAMVAGALPLGALAAAFNYARFGNILDTGYAYIGGGNIGPTAMFHPRMIPRNLYTMFFRGVNLDVLYEPDSVSSAVNFKYGILASPVGTGLIYASPFFIFAFLASVKNRLVPLGWTAVLACLIPIACYKAIGMMQINCARYALDFLPIVFVLTIFGTRHRHFSLPLFKILVGYSVLLNAVLLTPYLARGIELYVKSLF